MTMIKLFIFKLFKKPGNSYWMIPKCTRHDTSIELTGTEKNNHNLLDKPALSMIYINLLHT